MDTKAQLQKLIEQIKTKQFRDGEAQGLTKSVGGEITKQLKPAFEALGKDLTSNISSAIKELKINVPEGKQAQVNVNVPDVIVPDIKVPEPKVTVNIPPFPRIPDFPKLEMPETMKVFGSVEIANNDYTNPLKVQLVDLKNRPYESVGGGGFAGGVKINNSSSEPIPVAGTFVSSAPDSTAAVLINREGSVYNSDNPLPVTVTSGATATTAVNVVDSSGVAYSGTNPIPVAITSGATATTAVQNLNADGTYRDTFPVSGSVAVSGITGSIGATILNGEGLARDTWGVTGTLTGITNTIGVYNLDSAGLYRSTFPISGSITGITNSTAVTILNGEGLARDTWSVSGIVASVGVSLLGSDGLAFGTTKPIPVTMVAGVSGTTGTANVDSSGVQYSGSNPMPTYLVAGSGNSTVSVGVTVADAVDDGSAPIKNGGIARTANPTAVAGGDIVSYSADDLGRQITRPIQVRDLIATAYVAKATGSTFGTETTLLASGSGVYLDLIYMMGTNDSNAAISIDFRASTGGTICKTLEIPAYGTAGVSLQVPYPAPFSDHTWTIDAPDVTGTNITISALFSKEV